MSRKLLLTLSVCAVLTLMAAPSWSKTNTKDSIKATINLYSPAQVMNKDLAPGTYTVIAEGNEAKFEKDGKIVAQVPCTFKALSQKAPQDDFLLNHNQLTEIDVSGKMQAIAFGS